MHLLARCACKAGAVINQTLLITLCAYVQQDYVFGHVGLCMNIHVGIYVDKKRTAWGHTTGKSLVSVIYCLLFEFNSQERGSLRQEIHFGKKFGSILLTGREKGSGKLYYGKPCLVYMQCSYSAPLVI